MIKKLKLNLHPLLKKLEVFTKKKITGELSGEYRSAYKGAGYEFEGYRDYTPGADSDAIDWKASLRARKVLVRELVEERNLNVHFLFDVSNSMLFASTEKLKCEYAAEVIASLASPILQTGDSVGLAMFTDKIVKELVPAMGKKQYFSMIKTLSDPQLYAGNFDLANALKHVSTYLRKNSSLIIVSDFIGLKGEEWKKHVKIASGKYDILAMIVRDPLDISLPTNVGQVVVQDPYSNDEMLIDPDILRPIYEENARKKLLEVEETFAKSKADTVLLKTDESFTQPIITLFEKRKLLWR